MKDVYISKIQGKKKQQPNFNKASRRKVKNGRNEEVRKECMKKLLEGREE